MSVLPRVLTNLCAQKQKRIFFAYTEHLNNLALENAEEGWLRPGKLTDIVYPLKSGFFSGMDVNNMIMNVI
jgi:hypothetical protein